MPYERQMKAKSEFSLYRTEPKYTKIKNVEIQLVEQELHKITEL